MNTTFCARGMLGETPATASPDFSVFCQIGGSGATEGISLCRDYTIGEHMPTPTTSAFVKRATDELFRICPSDY